MTPEHTPEVGGQTDTLCAICLEPWPCRSIRRHRCECYGGPHGGYTCPACSGQ